MKLMIKTLMIISLVRSVMSCKLYSKLLDMAEESFDKPDTDVITDMQDSDRSKRKARSLSDDSENIQEEAAAGEDVNSVGGIEQNVDVIKEDRVVLESLNDKSKKGVVVDEALIVRENKAIVIYSQAEKQLLEINKICEDLNKIKVELDRIKAKLTEAETEFNKRRLYSNDSATKLLLVQLGEVIKKIKISRNIAEKTSYDDAVCSLEHARDNFERAKRKSDNALGGHYYPYVKEAREAIEGAERLFKDAKESKGDLETQMKQIDKDFDELKETHEALKKK